MSGPLRLRTIVDGLLVLWQVDARACFEEEGTRCRILRGDRLLADVARESGPQGTLWRIDRPGRLPRVHRSVVPALASLREVLAPDRAAGRALFVPPPAPDTERG